MTTKNTKVTFESEFTFKELFNAYHQLENKFLALRKDYDVVYDRKEELLKENEEDQKEVKDMKTNVSELWVTIRDLKESTLRLNNDLENLSEEKKTLTDYLDLGK